MQTPVTGAVESAPPALCELEGASDGPAAPPVETEVAAPWTAVASLAASLSTLEAAVTLSDAPAPGASLATAPVAVAAQLTSG